MFTKTGLNRRDSGGTQGRTCLVRTAYKYTNSGTLSNAITCKNWNRNNKPKVQIVLGFNFFFKLLQVWHVSRFMSGADPEMHKAVTGLAGKSSFFLGIDYKTLMILIVSLVDVVRMMASYTKLSF